MQTDQTKLDSLHASLANKPLGELFWILYNHQGGNSPEGQPIRKILGMGQFDRMTGFQIEMGKRWAEKSDAVPLRLENAPIGTRAPASGGGAWIKTEQGWQWGTNGSTFARPGGDWTGELIAPALSTAVDKLTEDLEDCSVTLNEIRDKVGRLYEQVKRDSDFVNSTLKNYKGK